MKIDDLLKLKEAGFSSEEISNLANVLDKEEIAPTPQHEPPELPDYSVQFEELKTSLINEMKNMFLNAPQNTNDVSTHESVDDILKKALGGK